MVPRSADSLGILPTGGIPDQFVTGDHLVQEYNHCNLLLFIGSFLDDCIVRERAARHARCSAILAADDEFIAGWVSIRCTDGVRTMGISADEGRKNPQDFGITH